MLEVLHDARKARLGEVLPSTMPSTIASALVPRSEEEKTVMSKARDESKTSGNPGFKCRIYGNLNCFKNACFASVRAFQYLFFIALRGWFCQSHVTELFECAQVERRARSDFLDAPFIS